MTIARANALDRATELFAEAGTLEQLGRDALWLWFELSYASFLTLPRVLMHEMPDDWQARMAALLNEFDEAFPNKPEYGTRVQLTVGNRFVKAPEWLLNYRRPDRDAIAQIRGEGQSS